jgi:hypothetical protein
MPTGYATVSYLGRDGFPVNQGDGRLGSKRENARKDCLFCIRNKSIVFSPSLFTRPLTKTLLILNVCYKKRTFPSHPTA